MQDIPSAPVGRLAFKLFDVLFALRIFDSAGV